MAIKIMLDAGHTGKRYNRGAVSAYYESAVMWQLHEYLAEELEARGFVVGKTRKNIDVSMDVTARGKAAKGYDLLLSLHSNACDSPTTRRAVCIYQTDDSQGVWDTESKAVANKLAAVIADVMGVTWKNYSKLAGGDRDGDGKKDDNYYGVLHGARLRKVPAVIVEHSFHSNAETCRWLMNDANLRKLAAAEADCLADHYGLTVEKLPTKEVEKPVESNGIKLDYAKAHSDKYDKTYTVKPSNGLNMRAGAGSDKAKITALKKGAKFRCYGYYTKVGKTVWLYGVSGDYKGFCSKDYLK